MSCICDYEIVRVLSIYVYTDIIIHTYTVSCFLLTNNAEFTGSLVVTQRRTCLDPFQSDVLSLPSGLCLRRKQ